MPKAEIIAIGSELLLGETQDTNTVFLLKELRNLGIDVFRTMIIGDNTQRIASVIKEGFTRSDIIITTGGLGPTIDDPTREAVSLAFDCPLVFSEELWQQVLAYFLKMGRTPTANNKRQAYFPEIAEPILNPVGTAPAFSIFQDGKFLVSLPGVPSEMKYLFTETIKGILQEHFPGETALIVRTLHTYGVGESIVDEKVEDLEKSSNPTLGLSAKMGQIDLRMTAKGATSLEARQSLAEFEKIIRQRLGDNIYGCDDDTLQQVTNRLLHENNARLNLFEYGTEGMITAAIQPDAMLSSNQDGWYNPKADQTAQVQAIFSDHPDERTLCCILTKNGTGFTDVDIYLSAAGNLSEFHRKYNPLTFSMDQSLFAALDLIRRSLIH